MTKADVMKTMQGLFAAAFLVVGSFSTMSIVGSMDESAKRQARMTELVAEQDTLREQQRRRHQPQLMSENSRPALWNPASSLRLECRT